MASQNQFDSLMRELELERENAFENLLQVEEELESKVFPFASPPRQSSSAGDPEIKWLQQALNRVSAFGIAEDGVQTEAPQKIVGDLTNGASHCNPPVSGGSVAHRRSLSVEGGKVRNVWTQSVKMAVLGAT